MQNQRVRAVFAQSSARSAGAVPMLLALAVSASILALLAAAGCGAKPTCRAPAKPRIDSIAPTSAPRFTAAVQLEVRGTGFDSSSLIVWDESTFLPTAFVSPTLLLGTIAFEKLQDERSASIQVFNPGSECSAFEVLGELSNKVTFTVTP